MKFGLSDTEVNTIESVLKGFPGIRSAIIYGSRAKGTNRPGSDIDIALMTDTDFTQDELLKLLHEFDESNLPYLFDITEYAAIRNTDLKDHIDRVGKSIYQRS